MKFIFNSQKAKGKPIEWKIKLPDGTIKVRSSRRKALSVLYTATQGMKDFEIILRRLDNGS